MDAKVLSPKGNNLEKLKRSPSIVLVFMSPKNDICHEKSINKEKMGLETASLEWKRNSSLKEFFGILNKRGFKLSPYHFYVNFNEIF